MKSVVGFEPSVDSSLTNFMLLHLLHGRVASVALVIFMVNPFKPGSGLYPPFFAGRKREKEIFQKKLEQTIFDTPMHMSIIGDWATGKTSLMKEFKKIGEKNGCFVSEIIAPVNNSSSMYVNSISNALADDVKRKFGKSLYQKIRDSLQSTTGVSVSAFGFGASVQRNVMEKSTPQFDLRVGLRTIWENISSKQKAIILLIDDFDQVSNDPDVQKEIMLTQRNSIMEAVNDGVKIMCVVSGAKLFGQFESIHGPLIRFFEPYELGNLDHREARCAMEVPLKKDNIIFTKEVIERTLDVTQGHPYYLQEFSYVLYENSKRGNVDINLFESVYNQILHDLARKLWRQKLNELGDGSIKVLYIISKGNHTSDSINEIGTNEFQLKPSHIRTILTRLQQFGHIERISRGEYTINDKLLGEYILTMFE